nr:MAG TPA: hypothetical protein [Caudoviricetes sp.]
MPPTLCHETPTEGSPRLCVRRSLFHSASGESRKLHISRLLLPFRFRPAMLGSESDGDSRPQNPSSLRAGIKRCGTCRKTLPHSRALRTRGHG